MLEHFCIALCINFGVVKSINKSLNLRYFVRTNVSIFISHILQCQLCMKNILELYLSEIYYKFIHKHSYRRHEKSHHNLQSKHPLEQAVKTNPFIFPIFNESDKIPAEDDFTKMLVTGILNFIARCLINIQKTATIRIPMI